MKGIICFVLVLCVCLGLFGCAKPVEVPKDLSGKYMLHTERNEAIIDDGGTVTVSNSGNARVYYHIFVGSFSDSNGDGIGDLRGIIERFDYLNDGNDNSGVSLGVEGIWLSPIFFSPSYHKYDTTNYYKIDPQFGTMEDLQELIELCHSRNVQIILDLVINHTSRANTWFQNFMSAHKNGDTTDPYYDFYSWVDTKVAGATYYSLQGSNHYYEGNFSSDMPELNFDNEVVRLEMVNLAKYYLDMGVDGFRFDAAKYIYYNDPEKSVDFWNWYMAELRKIKPDIYTVAEVWDADGATFPYFQSTNCFNFSMSQSSGKIASTAKGGNVNTFVNYIDGYLDNITAQNPNAMLVSFIANHDTDRAAGFLTTAGGYAYMAANLNILLPGSSFIYYGEEIGMLGSRGGANTDANRRLAMLWGDDDTVKNPVGSSYKAEQINGTVLDQLPDGNSLYNHYKKLIAIRKANPEIAYGEFTPLSTSGKYGGFVSTYEGSHVMVLHNTTNETVTIDLSQWSSYQISTLAAVVGLGTATMDGTILTLGGQTSVVLR